MAVSSFVFYRDYFDSGNASSSSMVDRVIDSYKHRLRYCIEVNGRSVEEEYNN